MKYNYLLMERRFVQIGGVVIMVLLGIVGYFVQRLVTSTDNLNQSVQELRITVKDNQTENKGVFRLYDMRIENLEKDVECIQNEITKFRPNFKSE